MLAAMVKAHLGMLEVALFVMILSGLSLMLTTPKTLAESVSPSGVIVIAATLVSGGLMGLYGRYAKDRRLGLTLEASAEIALGTALLVRLLGLGLSGLPALFAALTTLAVVVGFYSEAWRALSTRRTLFSTRR